MSSITPYQSNTSSALGDKGVTTVGHLINDTMVSHLNIESNIISMILKEYEAIRKVIAAVGLKHGFAFIVESPRDTTESHILCNYIAMKLFDGMIKTLTVAKKIYGDLNKRRPKTEMEPYEQYRKIFDIYKEFLIRMQ